MDASQVSAAGDHERAHLERAHHEICTALTVFSSNVELVRIELRRSPSSQGTSLPVQAHLDELDAAVARLRSIAKEMEAWHAGISAEPPPGRPRLDRETSR